MSEHQRVTALYDYMIAPAVPLPEHSDAALVFGRKSDHLVEAATHAAMRADVTVVSGSFGKDSGDLPMARPYGIPESRYVRDGIHKRASASAKGPEPWIVTDEKARTGPENAHYGLRLVHEARQKLGSLGIGNLVAVGHSTQARRLRMTLADETERTDATATELSFYATRYPFDPSNRFDQYEVAQEVKKVAKMGAGDLPKELLEYAIDLAARHERRFKQDGIKNPSTADDTNRAVSPLRLMLMPHPPAHRSALPFYVENVWSVARAAARLKLASRA